MENKTKTESGVYISPYAENEKRVIGDKIMNVTYHAIDWKKNCAANGAYQKYAVLS